MKKIFLGVAGAVVIAAASVYFGVTTSAKSDPMTDLLMANVEALASGECTYSGNGITAWCTGDMTRWSCVFVSGDVSIVCRGTRWQGYIYF